MRLVDADALIHELNNSHYPGAPYVDAGISIAIGKVCDAQTIEPERKKDKWICIDCTDMEGNGVNSWKCSKCGEIYADATNFCPNCGAKMDWSE